MFLKNNKFIKFLVLFCLGGCLEFIDCRKLIRIGGIFNKDHSNSEAEIAFNNTILNENIHLKYYEIVPLIVRINPLDSFGAEKMACWLIEQGIAAIFGPMSIESSGIVASIANHFQIPHFLTIWEPPPFNDRSHHRQSANHNFTRNFYPDNEIFSQILSQILFNYDWKTFTIIYETDYNLIRLEDILRNRYSKSGPIRDPITVRQLPANGVNNPKRDYQSLLKEIARTHETRVILDCRPETIMQILRQAITLNMTIEYWSYFIASIDAHTLDFTDLQQALKANITTIRLMDSGSSQVTMAVNIWRQNEYRRKSGGGMALRTSENGNYIYPDRIKTETALLNDAIQVFAATLREYNRFNLELTPLPLNCYGSSGSGSGSSAGSHFDGPFDESNKWNDGIKLLEFINKTNDEFMTGKIQFNHFGKRNQFYLEILEMEMGQFKKIGEWDQRHRPSHGIVLTRPVTDANSQITTTLGNKTFIVMSRIGMPFLSLREREEEGVEYYGNDRYVGYSIDLIQLISRKLHFKYQFEIVKDNSYGTYDHNTKQWDGLVKELLERRADLAICDLTITSSRRSAVDFTVPFMTLGISILYAKPRKEPPGLLSFTSPLSLDVWLYMATAYLIVSIVLFAVAKISMDDWENPHPCDDHPEELENLWTIKNSAWLTTGAILQQGCDLLPKGVSTRFAVGSWWFFALIVTSSYTANLAAFLTMERMDESIASAEDLDAQSRIKFGAVKKGSTLLFFKDSKHSLYQRMYTTMQSAEPSVFTESNDEGAERVVKGNRNYAFFMESTSIEYIVNKNCNLTRIGELLDSKGYGIAMPMNSPYRTFFNKAILELQEEGKLQALKYKWWKEKNLDLTNTCNTNVTKNDADDENPELGMENVGGVFLVLVIGCVVGIFIGVIEFLWMVKKVSIQENGKPWLIFKKEFLFSLDLRIKEKPIRIEEEEEEEDGAGAGAEADADKIDSMSMNSVVKSLVSLMPEVLVGTEGERADSLKSEADPFLFKTFK